jgi:excisionase family DNA binding protein
MRNFTHAGDAAKLLSTAEAARRIGVSVATINRWADTGTLAPAAKAPGLRGARLFSAVDVERVKSERAA